ncbi:unnamed protein product, partial [Polarella glacialis]
MEKLRRSLGRARGVSLSVAAVSGFSNRSELLSSAVSEGVPASARPATTSLATQAQAPRVPTLERVVLEAPPPVVLAGAISRGFEASPLERAGSQGFEEAPLLFSAGSGFGAPPLEHAGSRGVGLARKATRGLESLQAPPATSATSEAGPPGPPEPPPPPRRKFSEGAKWGKVAKVLDAGGGARNFRTKLSDAKKALQEKLSAEERKKLRDAKHRGVHDAYRKSLAMSRSSAHRGIASAPADDGARTDDRPERSEALG